MQTKTKKKPKSEPKRHGRHHKHTKQFKRVYWPYLPGALAILFTFVLMWARPGVGTVMSYATEMSASNLLTETNQRRTQNGLSELALNPELSSAAQAKAEDMVKRNYWSHNTPEGNEPWVFINATDYGYTKAGENLAYGFSSSSHTVAGWMNSPSHRDNILDAAYLDVGFGFANAQDYQGKGPETVVVAMYGRPLAAGPLPSSIVASTADESSPVTSTAPINEPLSKNVALIQTIANGNLPWLYFGVGLVSGVAAAALLINHAFRLKKLIRDSENFVHHHPIYDSLFLIVLIIVVALHKGVGFVR